MVLPKSSRARARLSSLHFPLRPFLQSPLLPYNTLTSLQRRCNHFPITLRVPATLFESNLKRCQSVVKAPVRTRFKYLRRCVHQRIRNLIPNTAGNRLLYFEQMTSQLASTTSLILFCCFERKMHTFFFVC